MATKPTESQVREAIAANAKRDRESQVRDGRRDPGQAATEKVWKESQIRHEAQQRGKG